MKFSFSTTLLYIAVVLLCTACANRSTDDMISDAEACIADGRYDKALSVTQSCIESDTTLTVGQSRGREAVSQRICRRARLCALFCGRDDYA